MGVGKISREILLRTGTVCIFWYRKPWGEWLPESSEVPIPWVRVGLSRGVQCLWEEASLNYAHFGMLDTESLCFELGSNRKGGIIPNLAIRQPIHIHLSSSFIDRRMMYYCIICNGKQPPGQRPIGS